MSKQDLKATTILNGAEGMWPLNLVPLDRLESLYGFRPDQAWLDRARLSAVRLSSGGSASFVSQDGLVLSNHHVVDGLLHALSTAENNLVKNGFYAATLEEEVRCPGVEANVLVYMEDVTARVKATLRDDMTPEESFKARQTAMTAIQKESFDATGLRSDVVTLYNGGMYHLYRYERYEDVRLVWAPEKAIASTGGDIDNYMFPRFSLDAALIRVWHEGKPLQVKNYLKFGRPDLKENELLFVAGHPGTTNRLATLDRIISLRDTGLPYQLALLMRDEVSAQQFGGLSPEHKRRAEEDLGYAQNIRKRFWGQLNDLQRPEFMTAIRKREQKIFADLKARGLYEKYAPAWDMIKAAEQALLELRQQFNLYEGGRAFNTPLFRIARTLVRMAEEDQKPDADRLPEFTNARRPSLLLRLLAEDPIYPDLEQHKLQDSLAYFAETVGMDSPEGTFYFGRSGPADLAQTLIRFTKLADVAERKRIMEGGMAAINASTDSMIFLAKKVDPTARAVRKEFEHRVEEPRNKGYAMIAEALFALYGTEVYPDATFTLRLAYGEAKPYKSPLHTLPMFTTIGEVFDHCALHENKDPWELPERWRAAEAKLRTCTVPFNFLSVHDTHGGNSGSPLFDKDFNIVGLLFDGLVWQQGDAFAFVGENPGTVSVSTAGILYVLKELYGADRIVNELVAN